MPGRTLVIGDIHGCSLALKTLLEAVQPTTDDTLVTLGDYVDRGPDSAGVIELLCDLAGNCRFFPLLGNHELIMFQAFKGMQTGFWMECGGRETVSSYGGKLSNMPPHHLVFFKNCLQYYETATEFFIHANYDYDLPLDEQHEEVMFWQHVTRQIPPAHVSGKRAFVGHTPQLDGEIKCFKHIVLMDTFCFGGMWLSALDVHSGTCWQANNFGELRSD